MPPVFIPVPTHISEIIGRLIIREGGFVNHPNDPGKATNMGITIKTLSNWRGKEVSEQDVRNLSHEEASQIYYQRYWKPLKLYNIIGYWWAKEFIFDWCVNGGLKNPVRQIQRLLDIRPDGIIGPITVSELTHYIDSVHWSYGRLVDLRIQWYIRLAASKHSRIVFVLGWFNRANEFRYEAPLYKVTGV